MPLPFVSEKLLQFIWQQQYFSKKQLHTADGEMLEIISPGILNVNQGPDFLNGRIKLGDTKWAGNIELHIKTSDYYLHKHHEDEHYNNVVLHVVWQHDDPDFKRIPVLELEPLVSTVLLQRYARLQESEPFVACGKMLSSFGGLTWVKWKERMLIERMEEKTASVTTLLVRTGNHWEEVFWRLIARNFGYKVNADLFESVAESLPVELLAKHKNNQVQIEALLFGQANLLDEDCSDYYSVLLNREYKFLSNKYRLQPVPARVCYLRMRPANFPTIRMSQLASLVFNSSHLFSKIKAANAFYEIRQMLAVTANDYWQTHYKFGEESAHKPKQLGAEMMNNIIINTVVPVVFAYGMAHSLPALKEKALNWLDNAEPELNTITRGWKDLGIPNKSAADSQALLHLKNKYCNKKHCLQCAIGNAILKSN